MSRKYAVTGIGNAIVDILAFVEEEFLIRHNLHKGSMILIDEERDRIFSSLKYQKIQSGGSVANTVATMSMLGINSSLIGKVGADKFGEIFFAELEKISCDFHCQNKQVAGSTAKSYVMITPDGQRTMSTYLGKAFDVANEVNNEIIAQSEVLFIEGYLWDRYETITVLKKSIDLAKKNGTKVALTLSDSFCVKRHHQDFLAIINQLDILFANEEEIKILVATEDFSKNNYEKIRLIAKANPNLIIVITLSERGALVVDQQQNCYLIPTQKVDKVVDSTGAGDCFAAGFLYGVIKNFSCQKSVEIGNFLAGQVIKKVGARLNQEDFGVSLIPY